jgi:hypothetical protein
MNVLSVLMVEEQDFELRGMKHAIWVKYFCLLLLISVGESVYAQQNMGVGTLTPDQSAMLEVNSTSKGLLIPRLSTVQKLAIAARPPVCWYMTSPHHRSGILMARSGWRLSVPWGLKARLAQQVRRVPQVRSEPQARLAQLERQATQVLRAQQALKVPRVLLERTVRMGQLAQQVRQEQPVLQEPLAQTEAMVLQAQQAHRVQMVVLAQQAPLELTA